MSFAPSQACSETLIVISTNIEGLSANKHSTMSKREHSHYLCLQETHRSSDYTRFKIDGMTLVAVSPHNKYDSAVFVRKDVKVNSIYIYIYIYMQVRNS